MPSDEIRSPSTRLPRTCYAAFHKQLGDLVLLEPALTRLREHFGGTVRLMTRNGHADLVGLMPGVEFVRSLPLAPARDLFCFDPLNKSAFRSLLAPVLHRHLIRPEASELQWYHPLLFSSPATPELGDSYVAEFFWQHTPVPANGPFRPPALSKPPEEWRPGAFEPGGYVLVNPTAGWKSKMWTASGWIAALDSLGGKIPLVLTHAAADWQKAHAEEIAQAIGARVLPTTLREYLWLCANARAVLTVDGAASHLAAAFGVKCFTLFGPTSLGQWHRPAPGHVAIQAPVNSDGRRRLRRLAPESVIEAIRQLDI